MTQLAIAFGAMLCSFLLERFGPRKTNFAASVFILPAIAVQVFANSKGMLLAGKVTWTSTVTIENSRLIGCRYSR
jgi:predicted MFS family arabinose efflux permease